MKIKVTLEYRGEPFCGWQEQPGLLSVQGELQRAIDVFLISQARKNDIEPPAATVVSGSGRTDAGVHARGQVASFAWPAQLNFDARRFLDGINGITVPELSLRKAEAVADDFDARFSPHVKCYRYRFALVPSSAGLYRDQAWCIRQAVDIAPMVRAARMLCGSHDFAAFRAHDCTAKSTVRTVLVSELVRLTADELTYEVHGRGFLKQMVRIIAGTLIEIGRGRIELDRIRQLLEGGLRSDAGPTAPAHGLVLEWVRYEDAGEERARRISPQPR